ncbi:hypothetical protein E2562_035452 [Oryza meyeriana var. granulata]|uniref:Uncharacterized protein n=1 Tax=Oryza meyeriana var. granulata TaxID=110450 RepID=A0A6G1CWP9_9ORYZ|nr:hypothetical protein E2562_035452 [Oryza meyeriana var. granulata]
MVEGVSMVTARRHRESGTHAGCSGSTFVAASCGVSMTPGRPDPVLKAATCMQGSGGISVARAQAATTDGADKG